MEIYFQFFVCSQSSKTKIKNSSRRRIIVDTLDKIVGWMERGLLRFQENPRSIEIYLYFFFVRKVGRRKSKIFVEK